MAGPGVGVLGAWLARNVDATIPRNLAEQARAIGWGSGARMLTRAAVGEISTGFAVDSDTTADLNAFITSLRGLSLAAEVGARAQHYPLHSTIGVLPPAGIAAGEVIEMEPAPAISLSNGVIKILPSKVAVVLSYSNELLASPGAPAAIEADLQKAIGRGLDRALISRVAPGSSSGFAAGSNAYADLKTLFGMIAITGTEPLVLGAAVDTTLTMAFLTQDGSQSFPLVNAVGQGEVAGVPLIPTPEVDAGSLLLVDPSGIQCSILGVEIVAGKSTALMMESDPSVPAEMVSMFMTNSTAIRATATFSMQVLRGTDVSAQISEIAWASS